MTVLFQKLNPAACLPRHATLGSAGYDLCACIEQPLTVKPGQTVPVPTGLAMALPKGYGGFVFARSGLGIRHGVVPGNCVGVIDADYRGEVLVGLHNHSDTAYTIQPGDTLSEIAERFGTTVASLSALNGISDPNLIYAGNTLLISQ